MSRNTLYCKGKNTKKTTLRHLVVKLMKTKGKENILKQPEKNHTLNLRAFNQP